MAINQKENLVVALRSGNSYGDKPKRKSSGGSSNGKSFGYGDKPKRKSSGGESSGKNTNRKDQSSKKTVRSSDAKPKKRFFPAKKKSKKIIYLSIAISSRRIHLVQTNI